MINNIQALRAFAAINVVFFHIIGASKSYSQDVGLFGFLEGWGANGVDIFFVISGFVMLHIQMIQRRSPFDFFKNRILRIVPIYWLLTLFVIILYLFLPSIFKEMNLTPVWAISSLFFTSSVFTNQETPVVYVGWTLEWEMLFYLMFSIGLFFNKLRLQVAFVVASLACVSFISGSYIVFEFLFGMLVAYAHKKEILSKRQSLLVLFFGLFTLLLSLLPSVVSWELNRVLLWGIPSFFIVYGLVSCAQIRGRFFTYLGDASYSIYLVQVLTIPAFYKFSFKILGGWNGDFLALLCLFLSVTFGCLVYSLAEKPVTVRLKSVFNS
jgi:peptidoglycan/LPS O-acetylase OafA/YrhL